MSTLMVPGSDGRAWPTLGPQVADLMESGLVFGPGDLRGQPYRLDDEWRALLHRLYEVFPKDHPKAGRRRFGRGAIVKRKGTAKSEFGAAVAAMELDPEGPVRCDGWRRRGRTWEPVGAPVTDPYIPMIAFSQDQSDELAWSTLIVMLGEGTRADLFDIGLERIMRRGGDGKAVSLATAPSSREGARTTFELVDESHLLTLPRQKQARRTMLANLPKRPLADPWDLEITTRAEPGAGSVAEETEDYARKVARGDIADSRLFFFMRWAGGAHDLDTREGRLAAIIEASGPAVLSWSGIDGIEAQWQDPHADHAHLERVWLNRDSRGASNAFDAARWALLERTRRYVVPPRALIVLGFDGSYKLDATVLIAVEVASGYGWPLGFWERPAQLRPEIEWEVPRPEVDAAVTAAFETWDVWRLYGDPPYWTSELAIWAGRYGKERVQEWWTNRTNAMSYACRSLATAIDKGELSHDGDPRVAAHIGNARKQLTGKRDDEGPLWTLTKDRPDRHIDAATGWTLAWEARTDAIAAGALNAPPPFVSAFEQGPRSMVL